MFRRIIKYMLSSGISVVLDLGIFKAATYLGAGIALATAIARAISSDLLRQLKNIGTAIVMITFIFYYILVLGPRKSLLMQAVKYYALVIACATVSAWSVERIHDMIDIDPTIIKACVDTVLFVTNYIIQKLFIFRSPKQKAAEAAPQEN